MSEFLSSSNRMMTNLGQAGGYIFFASTFAVDPGDGAHISHKINHSRSCANTIATQDWTSKREPCIVLRAKKVCSSGPIFIQPYFTSLL